MPDDEPREPFFKNILLLLVQFFNRSLKPLSPPPRTTKEMLEQSVNELIEEHRLAGINISDEEKNLLKNLFASGESKAEDIMVPRSDILAIKKDISISELKELFLIKSYTRIPVYEDSLDNVIGFVNVKDILPFLLERNRKFNIEYLIRKIIVVPPSMKVVDILTTFKKAGVHIALVVDEFGGTDGLITIEDLVESFLGEVPDEYDVGTNHEFILISTDTYDVSARMDVGELEKKLGKTLRQEEDEDFDTLGGLILSIAEEIPKIGSIIKHPCGVEFEILDRDPRKIKRVMIRNDPTK
jgi:hemolysin (HlyC) family protein